MSETFDDQVSKLQSEGGEGEQLVVDKPNTPTKPSDRIDYSKIQRVKVTEEKQPSDHEYSGVENRFYSSQNRSSSSEGDDEHTDDPEVDKKAVSTQRGPGNVLVGTKTPSQNVDVGSTSLGIARKSSELKRKLTRYENPTKDTQSTHMHYVDKRHYSSMNTNLPLKQNAFGSYVELPGRQTKVRFNSSTRQSRTLQASEENTVPDFQIESPYNFAPIAVNVSPVKRESRIPRPTTTPPVRQSVRLQRKKLQQEPPPKRRGINPEPQMAPPLRYYPQPWQDEMENQDTLNIHASDSDGYDRNTVLDQELQEEAARERIEYDKLHCLGEVEETGPPIHPELATILETNWTKPKTLDQLKKGLFPKYAAPENCVFQPPDVNPEIRGLTNANKRNTDVQLRAVQKSMAKAMHAAIKMFEEAQAPEPNLQDMAQTLTDMSAILGHASHDISKRRRELFTWKMEPKYYPLMWEREEDNLLFGNDFTQKVRDVNLRNSIKKQINSEKQSSNYGNTKKPFLGKGKNKAQYQPNNPKNRKRGKGKKGGKKQQKNKEEE